MIHIIDRQTEQILDVMVNQSDQKIYWDTKMTEAIEDNVLIFEFRMLADSPAAKHIIPKNKLTAQDQDGFHRLFVIDTVEMSHDANGKVLFVSALGDHIELASDEPIPPQTLPGQTAETAVQFVLANTRYQPGQIDFSGSRTITFDTYTNPLAALQKIASEFDLEIRFRVNVNPDGSITRIVDLLKPDDVFDGKEIVFGKDMTGIMRKENSENICTRLVGIGPADEDGNIVTFASVNGGKIYVEDEDAYQRWNNAGRHIWGIFEYQPEGDTEVTPQQLLDATKKEMEKRKNSAVEWEVQAAALEQVIGLEHERVRVGMNVRIKDEAFDPPIYLEARVLETEMPELDDPNGNFSYTFGNYRQVTVVVPPEVKAIQKTLYRNANSWTAAKTIAEKKAQTFEGQTPPTQMNVGDLWYNPASGAFFRWDGSAWILVADETGKNTAADTAKVGGKPSITVLNDITAAQQTANQAKQTADNSVQKGALYNGVSITSEDGFKVVRSDRLVQTIMNATTGITIQNREDTSQSWQDVFYVDTNGILTAKGINVVGGTITASQFISEEQYAFGNLQYVAQLTLDSSRIYLYTDSLTDAMSDFYFTVDPTRLDIKFKHYSTGAVLTSLTVNKDGISMTGNVSATDVFVTNNVNTNRLNAQHGWFNGHTIELTNSSLSNIYIRPQSGGEVRATQAGTTDTYVPVRASSFPTGSLAEYKEDIRPWEESALEQIRNTTIYEYYLKSELEQGIQRKRQGLVIGEGFNTPDGVVDGDGVEQYLLNAWSWKAIQELDEIQMRQENRIATLEAKIAELEAKIS